MNGKRPIPNVIHLGLPKTATTLMQRNWFSHHSQIYYLGKSVHHTNSLWRSEALTDLIDGVHRPIRTEQRLKRLKSVADDAIATARHENLVPVWSKEGWSGGKLKMRRLKAQNFSRLLGDCKIIIVIRHPIDWTESHYFQSLMKPQKGNHSNVVTRPGMYFEIGEYLEANWPLEAHGEISNIDYFGTIEEFANVFGRDSIGIFLFEDFKRDQLGFARSIANFMGVDGDEMAELTTRVEVHPRLTEEGIEKLKRISDSPFRRFMFRRLKGRDRMRLLGLSRTSEKTPKKPKATAPVPSEWAERINDFTAKGNRELVESWGIPLDKYDYPL